MGARGPKPKDTCSRNHSLTGDNLRLAKRTRKGKTYVERQCLACLRERAREHAAEKAARSRHQRERALRVGIQNAIDGATSLDDAVERVMDVVGTN